MNKLRDSDEFAHVPNKRPNWRESYYFNWVDPDARVSGFSTIGFLPNVSKREFVFALFYDDQREVYFREPEGSIPLDFKESLSDGVLSFEVVRPFKEWRIKYEGADLKADISWTCRFSAYDFGQGSGTSWEGHYEQSGRPSGVIECADDRKVRFQGFGTRDKSWGSRDWHIESWFAFHAQFENLWIGLRRDTVKGEFHSSGSISTGQGHTPITKVEVETQYQEEKRKMPVAALSRVHGADGSVFTFISKMISPTSFVRFERKFPGGSTELLEAMAVHECEETGETGTGLLEWLFTHYQK
ncbi:MAG: hypothetical protein ACFE7R_00365 [Candidatus Hodarchaeota archaeon]